MHAIVELELFLRRAKAIMSEADRIEIVDYLAANPEAGIELGGGLRKVRIARPGAGKRSGYRAIYVFGGEHMPIFLMTVYGKNETANLSAKELSAAVAFSKSIIASYGDK